MTAPFVLYLMTFGLLNGITMAIGLIQGWKRNGYVYFKSAVWCIKKKSCKCREKEKKREGDS